MHPVRELIDKLETGHATSEEVRIAMAAWFMRTFWPHHTDEERLHKAAFFVAAAKDAVVYECWAGNCLHYYRPDLQRIKAAVMVENCPCGARSARTPNELPKRPWKGKR